VTIAYPMPVLGEPELTAAEAVLADAGVRLVVGSVIDPAGVARAKEVPVRRVRAFHVNGMGASPSWNVFCIDNTVAFTPSLGVAGDLRLRADLDAMRVVGDQLAWAPAEMFTQEGEPFPLCSRGLLRKTQSCLESQGLSALVGCELEMVLTKADGSPLDGRPWNAYGVSAALDVEAFLVDLIQACELVGLPVEQVHSEYGRGQYELSLAPTDPITAADNVVLTRLIVGRISRRHGMAASFSPLPFADGSGNGAHQHLSLSRGGEPLFSGGQGPYGLTEEGASAVAGIVAGLPEMLGVLAGSVLSAHRLKPGFWSGAFACWGLENREAAVRFCAATRGNPYGANVEVKCVDGSANPYLATTVILGLALDGVSRRAQLPPEVPGNPAELTDVELAQTGTVRLPDGQSAVLSALAGSPLAGRLLGEDIRQALLAVRGHELNTYDNEDIAFLTERFRFAWSL
jgi:glutamine synthetase